jgi:hypothetical protein
MDKVEGVADYDTGITFVSDHFRKLRAKGQVLDGKWEWKYEFLSLHPQAKAMASGSTWVEWPDGSWQRLAI